jgi:hypothetical protein
MAKKVVATLKKEGAGSEYVKAIKIVKSPKSDKVKAFFAK